VAGSDVRTAAIDALDYVNGLPTKAPELGDRLEAALRLSSEPAPLSPETLVTALGEGWVAEEALAVGLYAVLATQCSEPTEHFRKAIAVAINHSGDSDSTGSIAGNILGAYYGEPALPAEWLGALEGTEVIRGMADRLLAVTTG
jgi:ADP-ribosylglycohydrolase